MAHGCNPNTLEAEAEELSYKTRVKHLARLCSQDKDTLKSAWSTALSRCQHLSSKVPHFPHCDCVTLWTICTDLIVLSRSLSSDNFTFHREQASRAGETRRTSFGQCVASAQDGCSETQKGSNGPWAFARTEYNFQQRGGGQTEHMSVTQCR